MIFSWMAFDTAFLLEIIMASNMPEKFKKAAKDVANDKEVLVSKMNRVCAYPDKQFVMNYRPIIEQNLLKLYKTEVNKICRVLSIQGASHNERQIKMSKKAPSASLIQAYIGAMLDISGMDVQVNEFSKFSSTVALNMQETQIEDVPLYGFQEDAISKLKKHFVTDDQRAGLIVMPTGSGKSRTSISFMLCLTNDNIVEIAIESGFSDHSNFSRYFKREVGLSPSAYRLKHSLL